jgi:hypothetical protein
MSSISASRLLPAKWTLLQIVNGTVLLIVTRFAGTDRSHPALTPRFLYGNIDAADEVTYDEAVAGAQRSDPKSGDPADYPAEHDPQANAIRIYNYVRMVRDVI